MRESALPRAEEAVHNRREFVLAEGTTYNASHLLALHDA
jgi:hypothetical protein